MSRRSWRSPPQLLLPLLLLAALQGARPFQPPLPGPARVRPARLARSAGRLAYASAWAGEDRLSVRKDVAVAPSAADLPVEIEVTGINSRRISASVVVNASPDSVWAILTDYDRLSEHVPNLVVSERRPHPSGGIRLFQEGAQEIVGFDFRASLEMDMVEIREQYRSRLSFSLVRSEMFASFDGDWSMQPYSRTRSRVDPTRYDYSTKLSYSVDITPRGLVPVPALEWRIREDVPVNLLAVKAVAEKREAAARAAAARRAAARVASARGADARS